MPRIAADLLTAALACVHTELTGYLLHRFLHAGCVAWMTRAHLVHHLELYGPRMKMRTRSYRDREHVGGIAGVGWEWIGPSLVLFVAELLTLTALAIPARTQLVFFVVGSSWSVVMFYAVHEAMHVLEPAPWSSWPLRRWFVRARRLHDVHHVAIDERGRFLGNFGMLFHGFDRLFGTYLGKVPSDRSARACE